MPDSGRNNQRIAERLDRHRDILVRCMEDAEAPALLAERGYDADRMAAGLDLHGEALKAYTARDTATGTRSGTSTATKKADRDARRAMAEIRSSLLAHYEDQPEHVEALGLTGDDLAEDRNTFLTQSRSTLATLRTAPYAAEAATVGLPKKKVDAAEAAVEALAAAGASGTARKVRKTSTDTRDDAYTAFQKWMTRFRKFARIAFRDRPDIAERVGL